MTDQRPARRHSPSAFPEIQGIRFTHPDVAAMLVNLSATGVLVECATRILPGRELTVHFVGSFKPATVNSRVVRCEVAGIAADGALRYHLGLAFNEPIPLPTDAVGAFAAPAAAPGLAASAASPASVPVLRNRW